MNGFLNPKDALGGISAEQTSALVAAGADITLVLEGDGTVCDAAFQGAELAADLGAREKWIGKRWTANLFTWGTLAGLMALTIGDHRLMQPFNQESVQYRLATWKWATSPPTQLPNHSR